MSVAVESATSAPSRWIVGPVYDLAFFSTAWLPPLLVVALGWFGGLELGAGFFVLWFYHLFLRLPHFAAMLRVTYLRPTQLRHYRDHWIRYFAIPIGILLVYALPLTAPSGYETPIGFALTTVAYLWGYQHIGMQNYGILQIYRLRSGVADPPHWVRLEKSIFYAIIVSVCVSNHLAPVWRFATGARFGSEIAAWTSFGFLGLGGAFLGVYCVQLWRAGKLRSPAVLFMSISSLAMVKWPFYDRLPDGSWFIVFNGHHSLAYLGLLFLMAWNEAHPDRPLTFAAGARAYARFFAPLVGFSILLILVAATYQSARISAGYDAPGTASLEALLGFFVAHYYVESNVWRFRWEFNRRTTLPLLRRPG